MSLMVIFVLFRSDGGTNSITFYKKLIYNSHINTTVKKRNKRMQSWAAVLYKPLCRRLVLGSFPNWNAIMVRYDTTNDSNRVVFVWTRGDTITILLYDMPVNSKKIFKSYRFSLTQKRFYVTKLTLFSWK